MILLDTMDARLILEKWFHHHIRPHAALKDPRAPNLTETILKSLIRPPKDAGHGLENKSENINNATICLLQDRKDTYGPLGTRPPITA